MWSKMAQETCEAGKNHQLWMGDHYISIIPGFETEPKIAVSLPQELLILNPWSAELIVHGR